MKSETGAACLPAQKRVRERRRRRAAFAVNEAPSSSNNNNNFGHRENLCAAAAAAVLLRETKRGPTTRLFFSPSFLTNVTSSVCVRTVSLND